MTRWYHTPAKLDHMYPSVNPHCFRGCNVVGSMAHIWWECPRIRPFWKTMFNLIQNVTDVQVPRTPDVALLNATIPRAHKPNHKLIHFILLGAKLTIANAWKQPRVSFMAAKRKISWIMSQEKLTSVLLDSKVQFKTTWEPWAHHMGIALTPGLQT